MDSISCSSACNSFGWKDCTFLNFRSNRGCCLRLGADILHSLVTATRIAAKRTPGGNTLHKQTRHTVTSATHIHCIFKTQET